jgi:hypothetical protein
MAYIFTRFLKAVIFHGRKHFYVIFHIPAGSVFQGIRHDPSMTESFRTKGFLRFSEGQESIEDNRKYPNKKQAVPAEINSVRTACGRHIAAVNKPVYFPIISSSILVSILSIFSFE